MVHSFNNKKLTLYIWPYFFAILHIYDLVATLQNVFFGSVAVPYQMTRGVQIPIYKVWLFAVFCLEVMLIISYTLYKKASFWSHNLANSSPKSTLVKLDLLNRIYEIKLELCFWRNISRSSRRTQWAEPLRKSTVWDNSKKKSIEIHISFWTAIGILK